MLTRGNITLAEPIHQTSFFLSCVTLMNTEQVGNKRFSNIKISEKDWLSSYIYDFFISGKLKNLFDFSTYIF